MEIIEGIGCSIALQEKEPAQFSFSLFRQNLFAAVSNKRDFTGNLFLGLRLDKYGQNCGCGVENLTKRIISLKN